MKKIISLFKRDYEGTRQIYDEVVPGAEWVLAGEGEPTIKIDGTCCMVREGKLYKRYDRKQGKPAPEGWEAAEPEPNEHTGHWPGWVPVGDSPEDKWHREAWSNDEPLGLTDGTYELIGPKVQRNLYHCTTHELVPHGAHVSQLGLGDPGRTFDSIRKWLEMAPVEGIVWHHPDGRMVKIKAKDFGIPWPRSA